MFKKFKVCDCYPEIACYCLSIDADFAQFRKMCFIHFEKQNRNDDVYFIKDTSQLSRQSLFHVTYAAY